MSLEDQIEQKLSEIVDLGNKMSDRDLAMRVDLELSNVKTLVNQGIGNKLVSRSAITMSILSGALISTGFVNILNLLSRTNYQTEGGDRYLNASYISAVSLGATLIILSSTFSFLRKVTEKYFSQLTYKEPLFKTDGRDIYLNDGKIQFTSQDSQIRDDYLFVPIKGDWAKLFQMYRNGNETCVYLSVIPFVGKKDSSGKVYIDDEPRFVPISWDRDVTQDPFYFRIPNNRKFSYCSVELDWNKPLSLSKAFPEISFETTHSQHQGTILKDQGDTYFMLFAFYGVKTTDGDILRIVHDKRGITYQQIREPFGLTNVQRADE